MCALRLAEAFIPGEDKTLDTCPGRGLLARRRLGQGLKPSQDRVNRSLPVLS